MNEEIRNLRRKLRAGADFILTQPIYDISLVEKFHQAYQAAEGTPLQIPMIVGLLPLASARHANFLAQEVPGITIPEEIRKAMEEAGENGAATGVHIAIDLVKQLKGQAQGVYLMPAFGRYDRAAEIIEAL
jgi:homocysteine S-methyltransferase